MPSITHLGGTSPLMYTTKRGSHKEEMIPKTRKSVSAQENYDGYSATQKCSNAALEQLSWVKSDECLVVSTVHHNHLPLPCIADHEICIRRAVASDLQGKDHRSPLFRTSLSPREA